LDALGNTSQGEIVVVIVAAAAFSCLVGWLLEGGFDLLRQRYQRWLASARAAPHGRAGPADDGPREFGDEFVRALAVAIKSYADSASDEQAIIDAIVAQLGWSPTRARWFIAVNRDQVEQAARQTRPDATGKRCAASG
jgi:hypothetical protein